MISNESNYIECELCDLGAPGHYRYGSWRHVVDMEDSGPMELPCGRQSGTIFDALSEIVMFYTQPKHVGDCSFTDKSEEGCYRCRDAERNWFPRQEQLMRIINESKHGITDNARIDYIQAKRFDVVRLGIGWYIVKPDNSGTVVASEDSVRAAIDLAMQREKL